jgi:hypothetical protein
MTPNNQMLANLYKLTNNFLKTSRQCPQKYPLAGFGRLWKASEGRVKIIQTLHIEHSAIPNKYPTNSWRILLCPKSNKASRGRPKLTEYICENCGRVFDTSCKKHYHKNKNSSLELQLKDFDRSSVEEYTVRVQIATWSCKWTSWTFTIFTANALGDVVVFLLYIPITLLPWPV